MRYVLSLGRARCCRRSAWSTLAVALSIGGAMLVACDNSHVPSAIAVDGDAGSSANDPDADPPPYMGPTTGGDIPRIEGGAGDDGSALDLDAAPTGTPSVACCNVTVSIADTTNDETTAKVVAADVGLPSGGVALTWANGAWSANVCLPVATYVRYRFFFGKVHEDPSDVGSPLIDDNRYDPALPTESDGAGSFFDTFGPVAQCGDIDASTGMTR
jgi:hypothetical protein